MTIESSVLLKDFLNGFPNSTHPLDNERFAKYAIACAEEGRYINTDEINQYVSNERSEELVSAFEWIRTGIECLKKDGRI